MRKYIGRVKNFDNFINENIQSELNIDNLFGKKLPIEHGSGYETTYWDKDLLIKKISDVITHNLFDRDFYYNWTNNGEEYFYIFKIDTLTPMMNDIDNTLNKFFVFKRTPYSTLEDVLVFKIDNRQLWIDNWFQNNKSISDELRSDYYRYRQKYADITL